MVQRERGGKVKHSVVAHEIRHVADYLLEDSGIKFGPKCCVETAAMAQEYVTREVYRLLGKWREKLV